MKDEIYGIIYLTINNINNKKYIGQHKTTNILDSYLGSGSILLKSIEKYGRENFTRRVLDFAYSKEDLCEKEVWWIKYFNAVESGEYYNIHEGGFGGNTMAGFSGAKKESFRKKMSKLNMW